MLRMNKQIYVWRGIKPAFHTGVGLGRFARDFGCILRQASAQVEDFFLFTIAGKMMKEGKFLRLFLFAELNLFQPVVFKITLPFIF